MKIRLLLMLMCFSTLCLAQPRIHAHNDYQQSRPFIAALNAGAWSIEVDVFEKNGTLYVAHTQGEIDTNKTLKNMYLEIAARLGQRKKSQLFQLMIDIKTDFNSTYPVLMKELKPYIQRIEGKVLVTISGNRPLVGTWHKYPKYIHFDGVLNVNYSKQELNRIPMISANFKNFSNWNGIGVLPPEDKLKLQSAIADARKLGKPMRFWNAPDEEHAWKILSELGAEIINTDKVSECVQFFNQ